MMRPKTSEFALVLGGWAARWFAHIGVLQFLEENNLFPKEISGTSMGAIIAALFACGKTSREIISYIRPFRVFQVLDIVPNGRIMNPKKVRNKLSEWLGDMQFSDTKIPLKITAVSLCTGEVRVFTEGSIIEALMASIALPGLLPPHSIDNHLFIDGGMRINLPVSLHKNIPIIASSAIRTPFSRMKKYSIFETVRLFEAVFGMMLFDQENYDIQNKRQSEKILLLRSEEKTVHFLSFWSYQKMIKSWYKSALEAKILDFLHL